MDRWRTALKRPLPSWVAVLGALALAAVAFGPTAVAGLNDEGKKRAEPAGAPDRGAQIASANRTVLADGSKWRYVVDGPWANDGGTQSSGEVACGKRWRVTGGGVLAESETPGEQLVNSSYPEDDDFFDEPVAPPDGNDRPDDGWVAYVDNTSGNDYSFIVWAICKKRG